LTRDGGAVVFVVAWLTKFLVGRGFVVTRWGTVRQPVTRLGTRDAQESFWPKKKHVVTRRRVTIHILFKYQIPNYELFDSKKNYEFFMFLFILGDVLWALIF
jgi:hypothetical protein